MGAISEKEPYFKGLDQLSSYDRLTGLYNKTVMENYVMSLVDAGREFAVIQCDVDNFRTINETYGNEVGDQMLIGIGKVLNRVAGSYAVVGRHDGDRFIIVMPDVSDYDDVWAKCKLITSNINGKVNDEIGDATLTVTLGLSRFPLDASGFEDLELTCKKALFRGKQKGRSCFIIYLPEKHADIDIGEAKRTENKQVVMHAKIAQMITASEDLVENIVLINRYLSSTLMLDHICIESEKYMLASQVHRLAYAKDFEHISIEPVKRISNNFGLVYYSDIKDVKISGEEEFYESLLAQGITSNLYVSIEAYGKLYGYIRIESTQPDGRSWQEKDIDLFIGYARMLGLILHFKDLSIDKLFFGSLI